MNSGTARTAVETPSVQPRFFENGAPDVFIILNSNLIHQILILATLVLIQISILLHEQRSSSNDKDGLNVKSPEIFMNVLERRLVMDNIDRTNWVTYLGAALEGTQQRIWFAKFVEFSSIQYT